jgi:hypothetical protein
VRFNLSISHKRPLFNNNTKAKIRRCTTYVEPYISSFYGMLLRCCWRGSSPALPGAAFATHSSRLLLLPAIQQHPQEGGCAPSRMHVRARRPMPTVTGIVIISSRMRRNEPAHPFTKYTSSRSPCQEIFLIYFGGGSLPLPAALPFCHPGAEGDRVQGKSSGHPLSGASIAGPATPRSPAQLLENFEEFKNHKLMRKSD